MLCNLPCFECLLPAHLRSSPNSPFVSCAPHSSACSLSNTSKIIPILPLKMNLNTLETVSLFSLVTQRKNQQFQSYDFHLLAQIIAIISTYLIANTGSAAEDSTASCHLSPNTSYGKKKEEQRQVKSFYC